VQATPPDDVVLTPWASNERENFFDAVNRYQRATWRVTAACGAAAFIVFMVFPILLAPLFCSAAVLLFDILNRFISVPDLAPKVLPILNIGFELLSWAVKLLDPKSGGLGTVGSFFGLHGEAAKSVAKLSGWHSLPSLLLALSPGIAILMMAGFAVNRAIKLSPLFDANIEIGRPPDASKPTEQRLRNTLEEMAVAASLPAPKVRVIDGGKNAAVVGRDSQHAAVLVGSALLDNLNREQIQALAAQLIGSIVNGDIAIGRQTTLTLGLFALLSRCSTGFLDRGTAKRTLTLIHAVLFPSKSNSIYLLAELAEPIDNKTLVEANMPAASTEQNKFRIFIKSMFAIALFPLMLGGLVVGLLSSVGLSSGIAYLWRQRKYMTDATAFRLTRNPDALVSELDLLSANAGPLHEANWASHMQIISPGLGDDNGIVKNAAIAFPSADARRKALVTMGAKNIGLQKYEFTQRDYLIFAFAGVLLLFAVFLLAIAVSAMMGIALIGAAAVSGLPVFLFHLILR
jgi:Zn-dependent protease with chaperone function